MQLFILSVILKNLQKKYEMKNSIALEIKNLSKSFKLPTESSNELKRVFVNWAKGIKGYKEQKVIQDMSFSVEKGDFFGIVGKNGSGKSTLLKLISGIYNPDKGAISVDGKLVPFIELGVGFSPELTGAENIFLNGALLGFSRKEIKDMYEEIVDFAELHEFMGQKLKNYSSGMQVRLAFSIAIKSQGDILILDEVLAVGDEAFQRKCNNYFDMIRRDQSKTVILVTHSMESVRKYCNKALMLNRGKIEAIGSPDDIAGQYTLENLNNTQNKSGAVKIKPISKQMINNGEDLVFEVEYREDNQRPKFLGISIWCGDVAIFSDDTREFSAKQKRKNRKFRYSYPTKHLGSTTLKVTASLYDLESRELIAFANDSNASYFEIKNDVSKNALKIPGSWVK